MLQTWFILVCRFVVMNLPDLGGLPNLSPPFTPESMTGMATVSLPLRDCGTYPSSL